MTTRYGKTSRRVKPMAREAEPERHAMALREKGTPISRIGSIRVKAQEQRIKGRQSRKGK
jgi:hypothetical protein